MTRWVTATWNITGLLIWASCLASADDGSGSPDSDGEKAAPREAASHVRRLELRDHQGNEIGLIDRPLLAYADSARVNSNGTVWAWGTSGRPIAFLELFQGSPTAPTRRRSC